MVAVLLNGRFVFFAEFACAREEPAVSKIHDGPEFHEAVFDGGSAHGNFHRRLHLAQKLALFAIGVFDVLRFVDDDGLPFDFVEFLKVLAVCGIRREQYIGVELFQVAATAVVCEEREFGRELLDFIVVRWTPIISVPSLHWVAGIMSATGVVVPRRPASVRRPSIDSIIT